MGCSPQGRTESDTTEPVQHAQRNDTPVGPLAPWTWFVHGGNMTWHHGFLFWPRLFMVVWGCTERCRRVSSVLRLYPRDPSNIAPPAVTISCVSRHHLMSLPTDTEPPGQIPGSGSGPCWHHFCSLSLDRVPCRMRPLAPTQGSQEKRPAHRSVCCTDVAESVGLQLRGDCLASTPRDLLPGLGSSPLFVCAGERGPVELIAYLFFFGCARSSLLCSGSLQLWRAGAPLY